MAAIRRLLQGASCRFGMRTLPRQFHASNGVGGKSGEGEVSDKYGRVILEAFDDDPWPLSVDDGSKQVILESHAFHEIVRNPEGPERLRRVIVGKRSVPKGILSRWGRETVSIGRNFTSFSSGVIDRVQLIGQRRLFERRTLELEIADEKDEYDSNTKILRECMKPYPSDLGSEDIKIAIKPNIPSIVSLLHDHWDTRVIMQESHKGMGPMEMIIALAPCYEGPLKCNVATPVSEICQAIKVIWPAGTEAGGPEPIRVLLEQKSNLTWQPVNPQSRIGDILPTRLRFKVVLRTTGEERKYYVNDGGIVVRPDYPNRPSRLFMGFVYLVFGATAFIFIPLFGYKMYLSATGQLPEDKRAVGDSKAKKIPRKIQLHRSKKKNPDRDEN